MVTTPVDPIRIPTITLSQAELEEIDEMIAAGQLPADFLERHREAVRDNVFGHDHKSDKDGNPIEQGRGSAQNMTSQSIDAYKRWGKDEPNYLANLARMERQLVESNARRAAEAARAPKRAAGVRR